MNWKPKSTIGRACETQSQLRKIFRLGTLKVLKEYNFKNLLTTLQYRYFEIKMRPWRIKCRAKK